MQRNKSLSLFLSFFLGSLLLNLQSRPLLDALLKYRRYLLRLVNIPNSTLLNLFTFWSLTFYHVLLFCFHRFCSLRLCLFLCLLSLQASFLLSFVLILNLLLLYLREFLLDRLLTQVSAEGSQHLFLILSKLSLSIGLMDHRLSGRSVDCLGFFFIEDLGFLRQRVIKRRIIDRSVNIWSLFFLLGADRFLSDNE